MALSDSDIQIVAGFGTLLLAGALLLPTVILGRNLTDDEKPKNDDMVSIEASIAYRKDPTPKQPQKPMKDPDPVAKPDGVSHDDQKKPDPPKPDKPDKKDDKAPESVEDTLKKFHHDSDDQVGKQVRTDGAFDGSKFGFGDVTKGDPFFGQLSADLHNNWEYPQILDAAGTPVGCLHLTPEGKVASFKLHPASGNQALDDSVMLALKKVQKAREDAPAPVPSYLLERISDLVCFRFAPTAGQ